MMKKKRFRGNFQGKMLVSVQDTQKDCNVNILQIIEIANRLTDENKQLKQLKQRYDEIIIDYNGLGCEYDELKEENEELKIELKRMGKENHMLNGKVNRLTEELVYCYEKLGW